MIFWAIPLPSITLEPLTLMMKGPGWPLLITVIVTLDISPIEANRLFKPRPASTEVILTVSPDRIFDRGCVCLCSISCFLTDFELFASNFIELPEFVRQIAAIFSALGHEIDKVQQSGNDLRSQRMFCFARGLLGQVRLDA